MADKWEDPAASRKGAVGWSCGQRGPVADGHDSRWSKCNRAPGHEGPHQKRDRDSFWVLHEWTDDEIPGAVKSHAKQNPDS